MDLLPTNKKHRKAKSKKKANNKSSNQKNPKAFNVSNIGRTKRLQQRNLDRMQQKEVVPLTNRLEEDTSPPALIVVMGPKSVGKSTLIRSLVKIYTKQNVIDTKGPITVIAGKKKRFTFFECPLDIYSMTDLAKVADLVLLLIDASYGFEMETFEFLNQLQIHGFPKVVGIMTHLDGFISRNKLLQNTKKAIKNRFWTEIYKGAKILEMSGVVHGKYLKHEVKRLSLLLMRTKFRPLVWRNTHPYILVDRVEDVTSNQKIQVDPTCNRDVTFYGYLRGTHLKSTTSIHLIGAGDFNIAAMSSLDDPCPLSSTESSKQQKISLKSKETLLYAPMANVGRVSLDKDGMYIDIKNIHYTKPENLQLGHQEEHINMLDRANQSDDDDEWNIETSNEYDDTPIGMLRRMQDVPTSVDKLMNNAELSMFKNSKSVKSIEFDGELQLKSEDDEYDGSDYDNDDNDEDDDDEEDDDDVGDDDDDEHDNFEENEEGDYYDHYERVEVEDNDKQSKVDKDQENGDVKWKSNMKVKANENFYDRLKNSTIANDLQTQIYGKNWQNMNTQFSNKFSNQNEDFGVNSDADDNDEDLFVIKSSSTSKYKQYQVENDLDSSRYHVALDFERGINILTQNSNVKSKNTININTSRSGYSLDSKVENSIDSLVQLLKNILDLNKRISIEGQKGMNVIDSDEKIEGLDDEEVFEDFEDLETGQVYQGKQRNEMKSRVIDSDKNEANDEDNDDIEHEEDDDDTDVDSEQANEEIDKQLRQSYAARKANKKLSFDMDYDQGKLKKDSNGIDINDDDGKIKEKPENEEDPEEEKILEMARKLAEEKRLRNKLEFSEFGENTRLTYEGFRQGLYVRILLKDIPVEFCNNFDAHLPIILGGLQSHEVNTMGIIRARVKRHRWHRKILKSNDPLIFSIGWRRFQSIPVYAIEDQNDRNRFLKYTPEHMHCICYFYGPLIPPNTPFLAYHKANSTNANFRISMTGTALEAESTPSIVKKLKLVGHPTKIFKNTAFISGMFNSSLEVAKFEGAKIKTVSGIRGEIKKVLNDNDKGSFRASFEDKILMSDIVVCRLWVPVEMKKFYNPVLSLLTSDPIAWKGMRTLSEIRKEEKIPIVINKDSVYKPIIREKREFSKLLIPKKLQEALPFASKLKNQLPKNRDTYMAKRAVILEPEERKQRSVIQMISTIRKDKEVKRKQSNENRNKKRNAEKEKFVEKFQPQKKEEKKRKFRELGLESSKKSKV